VPQGATVGRPELRPRLPVAALIAAYLRSKPRGGARCLGTALRPPNLWLHRPGKPKPPGSAPDPTERPAFE
jgi:hypothetical protein